MSEFPVRIHRQLRSSMVMKVTPLGVVVFIPAFLPEDSVLVQKFIERGLEKMKSSTVPLPEIQSSAEEIRGMVEEWALRIGVHPSRVQFRDMYRKWGSCSSRGNITLNTALFRLPHRLIEYVVCHELVHLIELNHGKGFKALMNQYMPDWTEREQELDAYLAPKT